MRNKINVNIYNTGKLFGITTPVYNYPMDEEMYKILLELGVSIEPYKEPVTVVAVPVVENKISDDKKVVIISNTEAAVKKEPEVIFDVYATKKSYTKEELEGYTKIELVKILNYRGHYSSRYGQRDALAPKFLDNKTDLINKILKTNISE